MENNKSIWNEDHRFPFRDEVDTENNNTENGNVSDEDQRSSFKNSEIKNIKDCNTGNTNTEYMNNVFHNTGDWNTGNNNTGNWDTGNNNTGNNNTGNYNVGNCNTGNSNTGNYNIGNCNTGDCNTGDWNTGDWNKSSLNAGCFNTVEQKIMLFNKPSDMTYREWMDSNARYLLKQMPKSTVRWIFSADMTDEEKAEHQTHETTGGYLKVLDEAESSQEWWNNLSDSDKDIIKSIPNFDSDIFEECTGIKVDYDCPDNKDSKTGSLKGISAF